MNKSLFWMKHICGHNREYLEAAQLFAETKIPELVVQNG